jgi:hypothetical protein
MAGDDGSFSLFPYAPSEIGAILFAGLFGLSTLYHLFQMIKGRAWFYTAFVIGAISTNPFLYYLQYPFSVMTFHILTDY